MKSQTPAIFVFTTIKNVYQASGTPQFQLYEQNTIGSGGADFVLTGANFLDITTGTTTITFTNT